MFAEALARRKGWPMDIHPDVFAAMEMQEQARGELTWHAMQVMRPQSLLLSNPFPQYAADPDAWQKKREAAIARSQEKAHEQRRQAKYLGR